jgi:type IV pilus assembly protein PilX
MISVQSLRSKGLGRIPSSSGMRRQRGVVLVIALILVVVIGVSSAVAIRSSMFSDMVSHNMRTQNLAFQAAEAGLKFCEQQVVRNNLAGMNVVVGPFPDPDNDEWTVAAMWTARANAPPAAFLGTEVGFATPPQCLIRMMSFDEATALFPKNEFSVPVENMAFIPEQYAFYRITARGFSPDYREDANGTAISGSQVTVQSMVRGVLESVPVP